MKEKDFVENDIEVSGQLPSESKYISLTPFLSKLGTPTAELLGNEIRDYFKEKIDNWKERRRGKNIISHIKIAEQKAKNSHSKIHIEENKIEQLDLFEEWVSGAQDVDPESGELAELWQQLLISIARGDGNKKILIEKLRMVNAEEASIIIRIRNNVKSYPFNKKEHYHFKELVKKGLIEKSYNRVIYISFVASIYALIISNAYKIIDYMPSVDGMILNNEIYIFSTIIMIMMFVIPFIVNIMRLENIPNACSKSSITDVLLSMVWIQNWRLTWIGEELTAYAKKVEQSDRKSNSTV